MPAQSVVRSVSDAAGGNPVDGSGVRVAIVAARFNEHVASRMHDAAVARAAELGATVVVDAQVAGSWDLAFVVDEALRRDDVDVAVALGVIVTGQTGHDEAIGLAAAAQLASVARARRKPVGLGVTGPRQTMDQAMARMDRAAFAVESAIAQFRTVAAIRDPDG